MRCRLRKPATTRLRAFRTPRRRPKLGGKTLARSRHDFPGTFDVRLVSVFTRKCSKRVLLDEAVEAVVPVFGRFLSICLRLFSHTVVSVKVWAWKRLSWLSRSEFLPCP